MCLNKKNDEKEQSSCSSREIKMISDARNYFGTMKIKEIAL
jgi:hypothetical protein